MALEDITVETIKGAAIRELQGLKQQIVAGANSATNIPLAGATVAGTNIVGVIEHDPDKGGAGVAGLNDRTSEAAITSDGILQLDTTNTTGHELIVTTYNKAQF